MSGEREQTDRPTGSRFVDSAEVVQAFRNVAPIDADRLRDELDHVVNPDIWTGLESGGSESIAPDGDEETARFDD